MQAKVTDFIRYTIYDLINVRKDAEQHVKHYVPCTLCIDNKGAYYIDGITDVKNGDLIIVK